MKSIIKKAVKKAVKSKAKREDVHISAVTGEIMPFSWKFVSDAMKTVDTSNLVRLKEFVCKKEIIATDADAQEGLYGVVGVSVNGSVPRFGDINFHSTMGYLISRGQLVATCPAAKTFLKKLFPQYKKHIELAYRPKSK